jgi:hypothetical protein
MVEDAVREASEGIRELKSGVRSSDEERALALAQTKIDEAELWLGRAREIHESPHWSAERRRAEPMGR